MRMVNEFNAPGMIAPPHFLPRLDAAKCTYCGKCVRVARCAPWQTEKGTVPDQPLVGARRNARTNGDSPLFRPRAPQRALRRLRAVCGRLRSPARPDDGPRFRLSPPLPQLVFLDCRGHTGYAAYFMERLAQAAAPKKRESDGGYETSARFLEGCDCGRLWRASGREFDAEKSAGGSGQRQRAGGGDRGRHRRLGRRRTTPRRRFSDHGARSPTPHRRPHLDRRSPGAAGRTSAPSG